MNIEQVKPTRNKIAFTFLQTPEAGRFTHQTDSGIQVIQDADKQLDASRWGVVVAVGTEVEYVSKGDFVLIEHLKWTEGLEIENTKVWFTDESQIIAVTDEKPELSI